MVILKKQVKLTVFLLFDVLVVILIYLVSDVTCLIYVVAIWWVIE